MIKEQIMSELQSYITTYNIEYTVQLNDFTEVVIKTKYTNPSMIARPEDKDEVARVDYDNTKCTNLKLSITRFQMRCIYTKMTLLKKLKPNL